MAKAPSRNRHHLVPRSRCNRHENTIGKNNLKTVQADIHDAWHRLFSNLTPAEVVEYIVRCIAGEEYFVRVSFTVEWERATYTFDLAEPHTHNDRAKSIVRYNVLWWRKVFGPRSYFDALTHVVEAWSPDGYFKDVFVHAKSGGGEFTYRRE